MINKVGRKNVACLVPMRGGSKGIQRKNIKNFCGKPLCYWAIKAALDSEAISSVFVSTDCDEIKAVVLNMFPEIQIIDRPKEFAEDHSTTESVMLHFSELVDFDVLVTTQVTSPFIRGYDFDRALTKFFQADYDSMFSGVKFSRFIWDAGSRPINYDFRNRKRRQDGELFILENGAFYLTRKNILCSERCRLGGRIGFYLMSEESAIEIDTLFDWRIAEKLFENF